MSYRMELGQSCHKEDRCSIPTGSAVSVLRPHSRRLGERFCCKVLEEHCHLVSYMKLHPTQLFFCREDPSPTKISLAALAKAGLYSLLYRT